jgi:hypothetical protein
VTEKNRAYFKHSWGEREFLARAHSSTSIEGCFRQVGPGNNSKSTWQTCCLENSLSILCQVHASASSTKRAVAIMGHEIMDVRHRINFPTGYWPKQPSPRSHFTKIAPQMRGLFRDFTPLSPGLKYMSAHFGFVMHNLGLQPAFLLVLGCSYLSSLHSHLNYPGLYNTLIGALND